MVYVYVAYRYCNRYKILGYLGWDWQRQPPTCAAHHTREMAVLCSEEEREDLRPKIN